MAERNPDLSTDEYETIASFLGYGNPSAEVWFVGIEEGLGQVDSKEARTNLKARASFESTMDLRKAHLLLQRRGQTIDMGFTYLTPVLLIRRELPSLWISSACAVAFVSQVADMQAQHRPSYRAPLEFSLNQPRIGQTLLTEPVKHEPCAFLLYADLFGDLHGGNALTSGDQQVHGIQPFVKRYVRPLEDRSSSDREVKLAFVAAVKASLAGRDAILSGTSWTGNAFGPEARLQVEPRCFFIGKHLEQLKSADRRSAHMRFTFSTRLWNTRTLAVTSWCFIPSSGPPETSPASTNPRIERRMLNSPGVSDKQMIFLPTEHLRVNHFGEIGRKERGVSVGNLKLDKFPLPARHRSGRVGDSSNGHIFTSVLNSPFGISAHPAKTAKGLKCNVVCEEFNAGAVRVNAADCGVLDDSFDVGHGGHPFKLFSEFSPDVSKVFDSLTFVKKKMRKSCGHGSQVRKSHRYRVKAASYSGMEMDGENHEGT